MGEGETASKEVTFELRSEGGERAGYGKRLATASAKALRGEKAAYSKDRQRPKWMEPGDQGGRTVSNET